MRILVMVMSCHKHWHLWEKIKNRVNYSDLIIFSASPKNENWFDEKENILYLNCGDGYESLPEKVLCMIDQILHLPNFHNVTHILKLDDHDTCFTYENIRNLYNIPEIKKYYYI